MNKPHKHCELIKAWADGAEIQRDKLSGNGWVDDPDPTWSTYHRYRIKPKTIKRQGWINLLATRYASYPGVIGVVGSVFDSEERAKKAKKSMEERAKKAKKSMSGGVTTIKLEWEEEE